MEGEIFAFRHQERGRKRLLDRTRSQILLSNYHKLPKNKNKNTAGAEPGSSIFSRSYFQLFILRKPDEVKFKIDVCSKFPVPIFSRPYILLFSFYGNQMKRWSKIENLLIFVSLIAHFTDLSIQSCRSADSVVLRMTHFTGKNRGKTKIANCTWNKRRNTVLNLSRNKPRDGHTTSSHHLVEYVWPKPKRGSWKKAQRGKDFELTVFLSQTIFLHHARSSSDIFEELWLHCFSSKKRTDLELHRKPDSWTYPIFWS